MTASADAFDHDWCGVETDQFRLLSDAPRADIEAMVELLRRFRPAAERYLPGTANADDPPLTILVFRGVRDFRRAIGNRVMVGYMQPSFTDNLMVVGPDPHADGEHESLLHEYVHYLLRTRQDINLPTWFDEGLAGMLSSARVQAEGVVIGDLPEPLIRRGIEEAGLTVADVVEAEDIWDWPRARIRGFYDLSRLLVHRLLLGQSGGQDDWREALASYLSGSTPALFDALDVSPARLQRQLLRYLKRPGAMVEPVELPPAGAAPYRCLPESDKTRQLALAVVQQNPDLAAERLRGALTDRGDDPDLWIALSLAEESRDAREAALEAARRAVALAPDDVATATRLAGALAMGCILEVSTECRARWQEAVPLLRAALRRDPQRQDAIFILGLAYLYSGRPGDALNYLRIAHRRQPWAPQLNFYLGESYRLIGDSRAGAHLERARRWSPNELWRRLAEAGLERLAAPDTAPAPDHT